MNDEKTMTDDCSKAWLPRPAARGSLIALALVALVATGTEAAKPGGGGGGTGGGTIYYRTEPGSAGEQLWSMNSDGTGKTLLPVVGVPSRLLHGGYRWFIQPRSVAGTYPNGQGRNELFAVRGDGNELYTRQLTDSPLVELYPYTYGPTMHGVWLPGDVGISDLGRTWDPDTGGDCANPPFPEFNPCVIDGGIYSVAVTFGVNGNVDSLPADPGAPIVPIELWVNGNQETLPNAVWHDWSPNAAEVVHHYGSQGGGATTGLKVVVVATGYSRVLVTDATWPRWSPDGSKIAFNHPGGIWTITPAGTGLQQILSGGGGARWSPTGSHVTYRASAGQSPGDVYRATATGGSRTNLTGDVPGVAQPDDWR